MEGVFPNGGKGLMAVEDLYIITPRGEEYLKVLNEDAPKLEFEDWERVAPEAALLEALKGLRPMPALSQTILRAIPEGERWPKVVYGEAMRRLVHKGAVEACRRC